MARNDSVSNHYSHGNLLNTIESALALEFFNQLALKTQAHDGPPPMGPYILMKDYALIKIKKMIDNIKASYMAG